jgi:hypothetical protein
MVRLVSSVLHSPQTQLGEKTAQDVAALERIGATKVTLKAKCVYIDIEDIPERELQTPFVILEILRIVAMDGEHLP